MLTLARVFSTRKVSNATTHGGGLYRAIASVGMAAVMGTALLVTPAPATAQTQMSYATIGEPPNLDIQIGTATIAVTIGQHVFETLYAFDSAATPHPLLATGERLEDDGRTIIITLRQDVTFHNGQPMTATDVAASLQRWAAHGARGKVLMKDAISVEATGDFEITLKLTEPNSAWKSLLAFPNGGPVIYPADIASAAGGEPIAPENYIGTGPYKFNEWRPNRYLELSKFDGYAPLSSEADGYAGARIANIDVLRFAPVPDVGTRVSGVQAGDYDYAELISGDLYDTLQADGSVKIHRSGAPIFGLMFMNSKAGPLADNFALRRAIHTALNKDEAMRVSVGIDDLWDANGSFFIESSAWHTKAGTEAYNLGDADKARSLADAAGYSGEPIKLLVSTNYKTHYDQATIFVHQLAAAGINVELVVVDWATLLKKRGQPDQWDMFVTHHGNIPDPILMTVLNDSYPGWWATEERNTLMSAFRTTTDNEARKRIWSELQALMYEQVPAIKVGDIYSYNIASPALNGIGESTMIWPHFWGASK